MDITDQYELESCPFCSVKPKVTDNGINGPWLDMQCEEDCFLHGMEFDLSDGPTIEQFNRRV